MRILKQIGRREYVYTAPLPLTMIKAIILLLIGVFGFIGVAVSNPKDPPASIEDRATKVNDGDYMMGYDKKAKGKNMGAAGAGWAVGFVILLILLL